MIHTAHRFADEAAMQTALEAREPEALDVIGVARTRGVEGADGEVVTASVELVGWHVNAVWEGAVHAAWTASVIPPVDAPRWWSGVPVEAASVPAPPVPQEITLRQLLTALRNQGWITQAEAIAAAKNGDIPSTLSNLLTSAQQAGSLTQGQVDDAALTWAAMYQAVRHDALWNLFTSAGAATTAQIDAVFVEGAAL